MSLSDYLFGRRLATFEEGEQRVGVLSGIPMLGLDALASAAYGPEAALTLLIPLGITGVAYIGPISTLIIALLLIVYFSYRQTIAAYPHGGGSYTVARENLGTTAGLLAAAALMLDYVLTVAVGISAGVGALVSALPRLSALYTLALPGDPGHDHAGQSAWRQRIGRCVHRADVSVYRHASGCDGHWRGQDGARRRPADARRTAGRAAAGGDGGELLAADAGVRQRLHGNDGRGGRQQRRDGVQGPNGAQCAKDAHGHRRGAGGAAGRNRLPVPCLWHRRDRARPAWLPEHPVPARGRGRRPGNFLLRHDRLGPQRAGVIGQHGIRRFSPSLQGDRDRTASCRAVLLTGDAAWCIHRAFWSWPACRRGF